VQNTQSRLVKLNEEYIIDLNRVVYVKNNVPKKKRFITVGFDLLKSASSYGNNEYIEIDIFSDSEEELERIFNLITKE
jgi:uncharacterized protein YajQ (UPF0234 family)